MSKKQVTQPRAVEVIEAAIEDIKKPDANASRFGTPDQRLAKHAQLIFELKEARAYWSAVSQSAAVQERAADFQNLENQLRHLGSEVRTNPELAATVSSARALSEKLFAQQ